jgi:hypothetical protein
VASVLESLGDSENEEEDTAPGLYRVRKWTAHSVLKYKYSAECSLETDKLSSAERGTSDWLKQYATGVQIFKDQLDEDGLEELQALADEWNKTGVPHEMQKSYASFPILLFGC